MPSIPAAGFESSPAAAAAGLALGAMAEAWAAARCQGGRRGAAGWAARGGGGLDGAGEEGGAVAGGRCG
jgi:hypothetical protein